MQGTEKNIIKNFSTDDRGWEVWVRTHDEDGEIEREFRAPLIGWAVVDWVDRHGERSDRVDPVFIADGQTYTASEYRRLHLLGRGGVPIYVVTPRQRDLYKEVGLKLPPMEDMPHWKPAEPVTEEMAEFVRARRETS